MSASTSRGRRVGDAHDRAGGLLGGEATRGHHLADLDVPLDDHAVDGCAHHRIVQLRLRRVQPGLGGADLRDGHVTLGDRGVVECLRRELVLDEVGLPDKFAFGVGQPGTGLVERGLGEANRCLQVFAVEYGDDVAGFDGVPFVHRQFDHPADDLRADGGPRPGIGVACRRQHSGSLGRREHLHPGGFHPGQQPGDRQAVGEVDAAQDDGAAQQPEPPSGAARRVVVLAHLQR